MPDTTSELAQRGKRLPREDRERLVDELLASLNEPAVAQLDAAWSAEIERRLARARERVACGQPTGRTADEVYADAEAKLQSIRASHGR